MREEIFDKIELILKEEGCEPYLINNLKNTFNKQLLHSISISGFTEYLKRAESARPIYHEEGKTRLAKKYLDETIYKFMPTRVGSRYKKLLIDTRTGEKVIANSLTANKPRYTKVNGQDIYNQRDNSFGRAFIKNKLSEYFLPYMEEIGKLDTDKYVLSIEFIFYIKDAGKLNIDNDNRWVWEKAFQDCLINNNIIDDDNCYNIKFNSKETVLIDDLSKQHLYINIYGTERN